MARASTHDIMISLRLKTWLFGNEGVQHFDAGRAQARGEVRQLPVCALSMSSCFLGADSATLLNVYIPECVRARVRASPTCDDLSADTSHVLYTYWMSYRQGPCVIHMRTRIRTWVRAHRDQAGARVTEMAFTDTCLHHLLFQG